MPSRFPLILLPTPLHRLDRVSEDLGLELWIKRDDLTGFAMGGNKGRKLEFLIADARASGAEVVVTCGAAQSNFIRQLGAACAVAGLRCVAVVMRLPYDEVPAHGGPSPMGGNAGLGEWVGIERILLPDGNWDELYAETDRVEERLREEGASVYRIPIGGSSVLGGYGFYLAGRELDAQCRALDLPDFDVLFTASSSGSTHTGLMMSLGDRTRVIGIACDPEPAIAEEFAVVGRGLGAMLELPAPAPTDYELDFGYVGPGYGVPSDAGNEAIRYLARREGIFLDPIYSGKAFSGLMARAEEFKGRRVLFWHTGGTPALFVGDA